MASMHPVVVLGSYMLDAERMPPDEFEMRLGAVQAVMDAQGWAGLIAHGNAEDSALVTYATNYAPRTRQALALVPGAGAPRLLVWTTPRDLPDHAALACTPDVRIIGDVAASIGAWLEDEGIGQGSVALFDGANMRLPVLDAITEACARRGLPTADADRLMGRLMAEKRPREMVMMRRSASILGQSVAGLRQAWSAGALPGDALLAAEGAAFASQAQDVRSLLSLDGGRTFGPHQHPPKDRPARWAAYLALRYQGYWSEGFVTLARRRSKIQMAATGALQGMIDAARPGASGADLARAAAWPGEYSAHAALGGGLGHGIGLSLIEAPRLTRDGHHPMVEGGVYSLSVGLSRGRRAHALTSAMIALGAERAEVLWAA